MYTSRLIGSACLSLTLAVSILTTPPAQAAPADSSPVSQSEVGGLKDLYHQLPLSFETNRGQTDAQVKFVSRGSGYGLFLTPTEAVLSLRKGTAQPTAVRLQLLGANQATRMEGLDALPGVSNYFVGKDAGKWSTGVEQYARVRYQEVYPGIDLVWYGNQRQLEYDFVVAPGADPDRIRFKLSGADRIVLDEKGELVLHTPGGVMRQQKPRIYQQVNGRIQPVEGEYVLMGQEVGFRLASYDRGLPLVIDPILSYSTYLGGTGQDAGEKVVRDAAGNVYVTGSTTSTNFPVSSGAYDTTYGLVEDAFVTKLNATGTAVIYSTYLGGAAADSGFDLVVDSAGNAYVTGQTDSVNFPVTTGALQTTAAGGGDAFVTKLNATGTALIYSTYLGGGGPDIGGEGIALDAAGNVYIAGETSSANFPVTAGAYQTTRAGTQDAFVSKLNATGTALVYSTFLGGSGIDNGGEGIAVDGAGNAYVTGRTDSINFPVTAGAFQTTAGGNGDAFVTKLNATGSALVYSTYLGGSSLDNGGEQIVVDAGGNLYVTGFTSSINFPTTNGAYDRLLGGAQDAFVTKLNATGTALVYSTYLGGDDVDLGNGLAVDANNNAYVTGFTQSTNFPLSPRRLDGALSGSQDVFLTKLNATGTAIVYSTYLGGSGSDAGNAVTVEPSGNTFIAGVTSSGNFPTTTGVLQASQAGLQDAFVTKINFAVNDYNNNGGPDILWRYIGTGANQGRSLAWLTNGTAFSSSIDLPTVSDTNWRIVGSGDFSGDGRPDILWRYVGTSPDQGRNLVWVMNGTTFVASVNLPTVSDPNWQIGGVGDFNGDSSPDILWRYQGTGANQGRNLIWLMNNTTFTSSVDLPTVSDTNWRISGSGDGDFNSDGNPDILWRYQGTGANQGRNLVWLMNGTAFTSSVNLPTVSDTSWRLSGSGDYNNDGNPDILWRYLGAGASQGRNLIWLMNNTTFTSSVNLPTVTDTAWQLSGPR
ncbi:MAG: SBBP repeat-containing protein [Gemmatimonadaceae bacterium]|nr:SBBP repeat-containing protein [Gloeobacterales cyanobacterium ES-bin-141]